MRERGTRQALRPSPDATPLQGAAEKSVSSVPGRPAKKSLRRRAALSYVAIEARVAKSPHRDTPEAGLFDLMGRNCWQIPVQYARHAPTSRRFATGCELYSALANGRELDVKFCPLKSFRPSP